MEAHVRAMPSGKTLAGMTDSLPFEANPNQSVPAERSMSIAIKDALQEAGFDNPDNNGRSTFKPGSGTVTYEGQFKDGDIVVTGRLVNGRIVLTKDFKPLTGSGEVGEPVRIRAAGQSAATGNQPAGTQTSGTQTSTANMQTSNAQATNTALLPPGARAVPAEVVRQWGQELYAEYEKKAQEVSGERDAQGRLLDMNGQAIAPTTVAALKLTQNAIVTDLRTFSEHLQELQGLPRDHKVALGKDLEQAAQEIRVAAAELDKAQAAFEAFLPSEHQFNNSMTRAAQLEKAGDATGAAEMRAQAAATPYGRYVVARARYVELLNATPLLGIKLDGQFLYEAFVDPGQFPHTTAGAPASVASDQRYVELLNGYLVAGVDQTNQQAAEVGSYDSIEKLAVLASPAFAHVHDRLIIMGTMIGSTVTADLMAELRAAANGSLKSWTAVAWERIVDRSLIVLQIGVIFLPGGPVIALGLAGLQILRAGEDTVVAYIDHQDALERAAAAGFDQVVQTGDNVDAAAKNLLWTTGLSAFDVYGATQYTRLMQVMRAEQAAARAAQQGVPESTATTTGATSTPAGAAPPTRPANTTPQGQTRQTGDGWDPSVTAPKTEEEIAALFKKQVGAEARTDAAQEVLAEMKLAREAGVDEQAIRDITKNFDPNGSALGNRMMADELMKARLTAHGYDINMPREEFTTLQGMSVRAGPNGSGLTPDDVAWLNTHAHPGYFENLPQRGFVTGFAQNPFHGGGSGMPTEGFISALDAEAAMRLQAAWKAKGGQFNAATADADALGTQIVRPGTVADAADDTGTVILPRGTQSQVVDPNKTALIPPPATDPGATTIMTAPPAGGVTQRMGPPTSATNPDATPTARIPPPAADPGATTIISRPVAGGVAVGAGIAGGAAATGSASAAERGGGPGNTAVVAGGSSAPLTRSLPGIEFVLSPPLEKEDDSSITGGSGGSVIDLVNLADSDIISAWGGGGRDDAVQLMIIDAALIRAAAVSIPRLGAEDTITARGFGLRDLWAVLRGLATAQANVELRYATVGPALRDGAARFDAPTLQPQRGGPAEPAVTLFLSSLGVSTGEAFDARVVNERGVPIELSGDGIVVEPLDSKGQSAGRSEMKKAASKPSTAATLNAYCLEFLRQPPSTGSLFRIASPEVQRQFAPMRRVLQAARKLQQAGLLKPDSNPAEYFHSIKQWAVWSQEQKFDVKSFGKAFLEHTKKNFKAAGRQWTQQLEAAVLGVVPGRWQDIARVLAAAESDLASGEAALPRR